MVGIAVGRRLKNTIRKVRNKEVSSGCLSCARKGRAAKQRENQTEGQKRTHPILKTMLARGETVFRQLPGAT
jgi:hypothetical protein